LLILGYHGVSIEDEHEWNPELFMTQELLRKRFEMIRRWDCNVLPLGEAIERLYAGTLPERAVAITFDDGLFNFFERALPLLKEFNFPSTLYATTFYVEYNKPVFGVAADYLLWKTRVPELDMGPLTGLKRTFEIDNRSGRMAAHSELVSYAVENGLSAKLKNDLLRKLSEQLSIDFEQFCSSRLFHLMTIEEIEEIAKAGVDVQLHTHRHRVPMDQSLFRREISDNRRVIDQIVGCPPTHFCYPSGEYDPAFIPWLKDSDVVSATTCFVDLSHNWSSPFKLPRLIDTMSLSDVEFEGWLTGVSHFVPQRQLVRN
jgi:peptidoglycan/xylan/chitin deacetylase (PgdA/CDA1 family)